MLAGALALPSIVRGVRGHASQVGIEDTSLEWQRTGSSIQATVKDIGAVTLEALQDRKYFPETEKDDLNAYEGMDSRVTIASDARESGSDIETSDVQVTAYFDKSTAEIPRIEDAKEVVVVVRTLEDGVVGGFNLSMHRAGSKGWVAESLRWPEDNPAQPVETRVVDRADGTSNQDELTTATAIADEAWGIVTAKFKKD